MDILTRFAYLVLAVALTVAGSPARGEDDYVYLPDVRPKVLDEIGIDEKLGTTIPVDLVFRDHHGIQTSLSRLLKSDKPVILTLNYSNCPGLCISQLEGMVRGVNEVTSLRLGTDFHMVSVSIDPSETTEKAALTQAKYSQTLDEHHDAADWQFWTGSKGSIARLTDAVGFRYTYDPVHNQYNHSTVAIFIAPSGKITRYLYELGFTGNTFKMATIEAGEGLVGSSMDMIALWCVHYDPLENRYSASARRLLSIGAGVFMTLVFVASVPFWLTRKTQALAKSSALPELPTTGLVESDASIHDEAIGRTTIDILQNNIEKLS